MLSRLERLHAVLPSQIPMTIHQWWHALLLVLVLAAQGFASSRQIAESNPKVPEKIRVGLGKIVQLKLVTDQLKPDICHSSNEAADALRSMAGQGGSSMSSGSNFWMTSATTGSIAVQASYGDPYQNLRGDVDPQLDLRIVQLSDDGWRCHVRGNDKGLFSLQALQKQTNDLLLVDQSEDGQFSVVAIDDDGIVSAGAKSFGELVKESPDLVSTTVDPQLRAWGVYKINSSYSSTVRNFVLQQLWSTDDDAEFNEALVDLNSPKFETREVATNRLIKNAKEHVHAIAVEFTKANVNAEVARRLRTVLAAALSDDELESFNYAVDKKLTDDPAYLFWLIGQLDEPPAQSPPDELIDRWKQLPDWIKKKSLAPVLQAHLFERLDRLTGAALGSDRRAWLAWLNEHGKSPQPPEKPVFDPNAKPPKLEPVDCTLAKLSEKFRVLLPLMIESGSIRLDRKYWAGLFNNRSVSQLAGDLKAFMEQNHLPPSWRAIDDESIKNIDYPQLLMQRLADELPDKSADDRVVMIQRQIQWNNRSGPQHRNMTLENKSIFATLEVDEGYLPDPWGRISNGERKSSKSDVYIIQVSESDESNHWLLVGLWPDNSVRIVVRLDATLVQVFQSADGKCWWDGCDPSGTVHRVFDSAQELISDGQFKKTAAPFLSSVGIALGSHAK